MVEQVNVFEFEYEYHHSAPEGGGESVLTLHTPNQGNCTKYLLEKTASSIVSLSIYDKGLVIYSVQEAGKSYFKTNMGFELKDDGYFYLVSE